MTAERSPTNPADDLDDLADDPIDGARDDERALARELSSRRWTPRALDVGDAPASDVDELLRDDWDSPASHGDRDDGRDDDDDRDDGPPDPWDVPAWARRPRVDPAHTSRLAAVCVAALGVILFLGDMLGWYEAAPTPLGDDDPAFADAGYELEVLSGLAQIEDASGAEQFTLGRGLRPGERIVCDDATRARLAVGSLGSVDVRPGSALALRSAGEDGTWMLDLERGEVRASIFAAPRLFQVGTPAGVAVDLGCMYTARVEDDGSTRLTVEGGRVSFETETRRVLVPAGAETRARPGQPPATPVWTEANAALRKAIETLDASAGSWSSDDAAALDEADARALDEVLAVPGARHSLTLFHLLDHPRRAVREAVYDDLARRVAPPEGVTRAQVVDARSSAARDLWREELEFGW
ncbi:MAG: hypothetical protein H6825_14060 [Planctomycetes bacterium]|nr:hypothetical protein [Planctomycetota bacterium]